MELTTFQEDMISNAVLGFAAVVLLACRDLCKRVAHSDCRWDEEHGLIMKLPTWRAPDEVSLDPGTV
jgi:hypothetical protein